MSNKISHLDYTNNMLNAIDILVDRAIAKAGYDQTIPATIIECLDSNKGQYRVKYQDAVYMATSDNPSIVYPNGSLVYVLIPGNDFSKEKKITGAIKNSGQLVQSSDLEKEEYKLIGTSCIALKENLEYCSYKCKNNIYEDILYDADIEDSSKNKIIVDEESLKTFLKETNLIQIGGSFKTTLNTRQHKGRYEIIFDIDFQDVETLNKSTKEFSLSSNGMEGTPLTFIDYTRRDITFEIESEDYQRIKRIRFLMQDFNENEDITLSDIWIKDLSFIAAQSNEGVYKKPYILNILTPDGIALKREKDKDGNLIPSYITLQAEFLKNGNKIIDEDKLSFYWFKANSSITNTSPKYSNYAGIGWECLNDFKIIQNDSIESIYWLEGESTFIVSNKETLSEQTNFKCVAVYNIDQEEITAKSECTILQSQPAFEVKIESSNGLDFSQDVGLTNLTCIVTGAAEELAENTELQYFWVEENNAGVTDVVEDNLSKQPIITGMLNAEFLVKANQLNTNITKAIKAAGAGATINTMTLASKMETSTLKGTEVVSKINSLLGAVENVTTYAELQESMTNYLVANPIPYKAANVLHSVQAASINGSKLYQCTVATNEGTVLGTAKVRVTNKIIKGQSGGLALENGNQVFKYSIGGVSPNHISATYPQTIQALSFKIYNEKGEALTEEQLKNSCVASWYVPIENTLLVVENTTTIINNTYKINGNVLNFNIKEHFDPSAINNDIRLEVKYQDKTFQEMTNFSFIKDGDLGTNGTEFYCRLEPNIKNPQGAFKDYITYTYNAYTGIEDWNFNLDTTKNEYGNYPWFKTILYKNGNVIEDENIQTFWKILKTNSKNLSNFSITANPEVDDTIDNITNLPKEDKGSIDNYDGVITERAKFKRSLDYELGEITEPYNIIQATVKYDGKSYFGVAPISTVVLNSSQYRVYIKPNTGFNFVQYSSDGYNPQYPNKPFEIEITENTGKVITDLKDFIFEWNCIGAGNKITPAKEKCYFTPVEKYSGEALNIAITCQIKTKFETIASIHFPIYFTLNRYEHEFLNKWNGNGITINEEDGVILAPQIIAGAKNDVDNTFTGILMGDVKFSNSENNKTGLIGFHKGSQTFHLNSDTGDAFFGPGNEVSFTFSKDEEGIKSDIQFGPWKLTKESFYKGTEYVGGSAQKYLDDRGIDETDLDSAMLEEYNLAKKESAGDIYLGVKGFSLGHDLVYKARYDENEDGEYDDDGDWLESALTIRGAIYSNKGQIGPWCIDEDSFGYEDYHAKFGDKNTRFYLGKQGISLKNGFKVEINDENDEITTTLLDGRIQTLKTLNNEGSITLGLENESHSALNTQELIFENYGYPIDSGGDESEEDNSTDEGKEEGESSEGVGSEDDSSTSNSTKVVKNYASSLTPMKLNLQRYDVNAGLVEYFRINGEDQSMICQGCDIDFSNNKGINFSNCGTIDFSGSKLNISAQSIILHSANGTAYKLKVSNTGALSAEAVD